MISKSASRLSRRKLLAGLGFSVAAAGAFAAPPLPLRWVRKPEAGGDWWAGQSTSLSHAGFDEWSRRIGTEFALAGGAVARLAEVRPLASAGQRPSQLRGGAFAAVFESTGKALPAGDRLYDVRPSGAGAMKIFFSACGDTCGGRRLLAIFN